MIGWGLSSLYTKIRCLFGASPRSPLSEKQRPLGCRLHRAGCGCLPAAQPEPRSCAHERRHPHVVAHLKHRFAVARKQPMPVPQVECPGGGQSSRGPAGPRRPPAVQGCSHHQQVGEPADDADGTTHPYEGKPERLPARDEVVARLRAIRGGRSGVGLQRCWGRRSGCELGRRGRRGIGIGGWIGRRGRRGIGLGSSRVGGRRGRGERRASQEYDRAGSRNETTNTPQPAPSTRRQSGSNQPPGLRAAGASSPPSDDFRSRNSRPPYGIITPAAPSDEARTPAAAAGSTTAT